MSDGAPVQGSPIIFFICIVHLSLLLNAMLR
jgi:hypothetical protein